MKLNYAKARAMWFENHIYEIIIATNLMGPAWCARFVCLLLAWIHWVTCERYIVYMYTVCCKGFIDPKGRRACNSQVLFLCLICKMYKILSNFNCPCTNAYIIIKALRCRALPLTTHCSYWGRLPGASRHLTLCADWACHWNTSSHGRYSLI